jgi:hypothetical protein
MNPLFIGAIVGHFVRDFLPAGLLPSLGGPAAQNPTGVRPSGVRAGESERVPNPLENDDPDAFARAPLGPIPLDVGISEQYERAVWAAYRDPNAPPEHLMGFSQALEQEGMPISAGLLRGRVLELGRLRESERLQRQFAAQAAQARAAREAAQAAPVAVPAPVETVHSAPVVAAQPKPRRATPRVRVTTPEPLTNGHNGATEMPPPDEEEDEPPPAAARA